MENQLDSLHRKIQRYLSEKGLSYEVNPQGAYALRQGSTKVFIRPLKFGENQTVVKIFAPVSMELKRITSELTRFLASENYRLLFGKFSLDVENKVIWYEHTLLGDFLDVEELYEAVVAVALMADQYDEQISGMAGGKRFVDI